MINGVDMIILLIMYVSLLLYIMKSKKIIITIKIFVSMWFIFTFVGFILFEEVFTRDYKGLYFIFLNILFLILGYFLGSKFKVKKIHNRKKEYYIDISKSEKLIGIIFFISIFNLIYYMYYNNVSFFSLFNLNKLFEVNQLMINAKNNMIDTSNLIITICVIIMDSGIILSGYLFPYLEKNKYKSFIILFPMFLFSLISTSKATIIFAVFLWLSGLIIALEELNIKIFEIIKKYKKLLLIMTIVILFLFINSMISRLDYSNNGSVANIIETFKIYGFAHIPAFTKWYSLHDNNQLYYGFYTFSGVLRLLGVNGYLSGVYESIEFGKYSTNIFTVFRSLIDDFGDIGCLFIFFFLGVILGYNYKKIKIDKYNHFSKCIIILISVFLFLSFIISLGNYFSLIVSIFLFWIIIEYLLKIEIRIK